MTKTSDTLVNNFNGGLLTPQMGARVDYDKYYSGCSRLENFIVQPWGGKQNRAGFVFIGRTKYNDKDTIFITFEYSTDDCYMIEAGDFYFRFYLNDELIMKDDKPYEVESVFKAEELRSVRYIQSADVLFATHPNHGTYKLMRYAHDDWKFERMTLTSGPFQDENKEDISVMPSANKGKITVTSTADIFKNGMEGGLFRINYPRKDNTVSKKFQSNGSTGSIGIKGKWKVETSGNWQGTLKLERSYDGGSTWSYYRSWTSNHDRNIDSEGEETDNDVFMRLTMTGYSGGGGYDYFCNASLSCADYYVIGIVKITKVNSAREIAATVINPLGMSSTKAESSKDWSFGSFSPYFGYPGNITFYNDRLALSPTKTQSNYIWFSCTGDYNNFEEGENDDRALTLIIRRPEVNTINWMIPREYLMIGSNTEIGQIKPEKTGEIFSPTNRKYEFQVKPGTSDIEAIEVDSVILFVQKQQNAIRELAYNWEEENYLAPNMTELCPEIMESSPVSMCWQTEPYTVLWVLHKDGKWSGFTYNRLQNITAWHKHNTDGCIKEMKVLKKNTADEVWIIVDRETPDGKVRCIEKQAKRLDDPVEGIFLDSALKFRAGYEKTVSAVELGNVTDVSAPDHLLKTGERVRIYNAENCVEINNVYTVEKLDDDSVRLRDVNNKVYINSSSWNEYKGGAKLIRVVKSVYGFLHLEGVEATVVADGAVSTDTVKENGKVEFPNWSTVVTCGLPYKSVGSPMPLDYGGQGGTTIGKVKRVSKMKLKVYKSLGGKIGESEEAAADLVYSSANDIMGLNPEIKTKTMFVDCNGTYDYEKAPVIIQDQPFPLTVLALICELQVYGG